MSENDNEQQKKNTEIGSELRKARQEKGYTLDDLQQITKIQKRYLIAIEDEKFDELPGDFYVRAFVKQYANTVGLDGDELLKEYDDDLPKAKTNEYSDHIAQAVETRASQRKTISNGVNRSKRYLPTVIIVCVIVLVLAAIWVSAIARSHRDSSTRIDNSSVSVSGESRKKASSSSKKAAKKTSTKASIKLKQTSRNDTSVTYSADKLSSNTSLQINPTQRAWMQVRANNSNDLLNRTLNANAKTTVKVDKSTTSLVITVGNAKATTLKLGGQTIDFTNNGRYQNTRTVTINFGSQQNSSSSSSSTSSSSSSSASQQSGSSSQSSSSAQNQSSSSAQASSSSQQTATSNATNNRQTTQTR